jgi:hypothetical protein
MGSAMSIRVLMPRYLRANAIAAVVALAVWMVIDAVYVFFVRQSSLFLDISLPVILLVAVAAFLRANWPFSSGRAPSRLAKALLLSLPAFAIWFVISTIVLLWFHPFIGGSE